MSTRRDSQSEPDRAHPSDQAVGVATVLVSVVLAVVTNIATGSVGLLWLILLLALAGAAILLVLIPGEDDPRRRRPMRSWAIILFAGASLLVSVGAIVNSIVNPEKDSVPVDDVLQEVLIRQTDLDEGWQLKEVPIGSKPITSDEFCGDKPGPAPDRELVQVFTKNIANVPRASIFSVAAHFDKDEGAEKFMDEVRRLTGSCTDWSFTPAPGANAVTAEISSRETVDLGNEAFQVVVPGGGTETAYLYMRNEAYIFLVTYDIVDLPVIPGDDHVDPAVLNELGPLVHQRFRAATSAGDK